MPVGDIYAVDIHTTYQNNPNIYCYQVEMTAVADEDEIGADLLTWAEDVVQTDLLPLHVISVTFPCVTARQIHPTNSLTEIEATPAVVGTRTTVKSMPGQCSNVWQLFTDKEDPTARNRGRDFWFGQEIDDMATGGNRWGQSYLDEIAAYYVALTFHHLAVSGNAWDWVIFSRTQATENADPQFVSNGGAVPDPPTFGDSIADPVIYVRSNGLIRTQRRRQPLDPCATFTDGTVPS